MKQILHLNFEPIITVSLFNTFMVVEVACVDHTEEHGFDAPDRPTSASSGLRLNLEHFHQYN